MIDIFCLCHLFPSFYILTKLSRCLQAALRCGICTCDHTRSTDRVLLIVQGRWPPIHIHSTCIFSFLWLSSTTSAKNYSGSLHIFAWILQQRDIKNNDLSLSVSSGICQNYSMFCFTCFSGSVTVSSHFSAKFYEFLSPQRQERAE